MLLITSKDACINNSVPATHTESKDLSFLLIPFEAYVTRRLSNNFRSGEPRRKYINYPLGFRIRIFSDCLCPITVPVRLRTLSIKFRQRVTQLIKRPPKCYSLTTWRHQCCE